uniref:Uncharacterized protein n=1 Tax=Nelumbo nucifera TaxID=4432 RepID=A0A822XVE8_NELNU|nr:TPA_asm: hypothetical protein HUJ06_024532 [Nelumbo nucifera]
MKLIDKACVAITLGAALGLKDQVVKPNSPVLVRNWTAIRSSAQVRVLPGSLMENRILDEKRKASEESLRMVVYLSCWGPN